MFVTSAQDQLLFQPEAPAVTPDHGKIEQVRAMAAGMPAPEPMKAAVRTLLEGLGEQPDREGLLDTPKRVVNMLKEVTSGNHVDLEAIINGALFAEEIHEPIVVRDLQYYSMCEHHMLPFYGKAHVAYLPAGHVVGLSKIPRVVEAFARRLQVQERMTDQIAGFIYAKLQPRGVAVVAEGVHFCAVMRGVGQPDGIMRTQSVKGDNPQVRQQLLDLLPGR